MSLAAETVSVDLADRSYEIEIGAGLLPQASKVLEGWLSLRKIPTGRGLVVVITDARVRMHADTVAAALGGGGYRVDVIELPVGEPTKRLEIIASVYDRLVELQADRRTLVVAVGGGVIGDAAGFVAATYARGLPFVQVPTTLLSDVDSSVGGKVGINHPQAKNLIGAFHQPIGVLIDTDALATLPPREFNSGLAEVVKYGVILDGEFFAELEQSVEAIRRRDAETLRRIIARSCRLKADVVERDEYERTGLRAVLNYGHTFGHAFEALCGYGELLHGEAVAIGMVYASRLAEELGRITAGDTARQVELLKQLDLPTRLPETARLDVDEILQRMRLDKKSLSGQLRFVLPTRIGHVELVDGVSEELVRSVLNELAT
ncbi:MAG: 3-dehydroquinate synthase [Planctomycetaceae bacterium]|nr:3-dehydroquinate synthase [Planctomycetaceae bacterium]